MVRVNVNALSQRPRSGAVATSRMECTPTILVLCGVAALFLPIAAAAATESSSHSGTLFIAQLLALLVVGRLLGEAMLRIGQPAVMGQLLAGILLGPSVFGALFPIAQQALFPSGAGRMRMIEAVAQLGILMLLLLTGMETDLAIVNRVRRAAASVSFFGVAVPFAAGFGLGELLPSALLPAPGARLITSLFFGIALSISSVKIVAVVVRNMAFEHRRVGQVLLAASVLDDTVGWIMLAAILGLAQRGHFDARAAIQTVLGTMVFLGVSFTVGRRVVSALIRLTNDYLRSEMAVITVILVVMCLFSLLTDMLGANTILGAFVAGMLIGRSPILTRHIEEQLRGLIVALFMPVFFGLAGLTANLSILKHPALLGWAGALIAVASIGKFSGSYIGGRLGLLSARESVALGCGMNARGSTEVILATLGVAAGALNATLFTLIVTMALVTTLVMPPMLRWALARVPISAEENQRLERAAFEARGYVPSLERMMAAVDQSPSGKLAARCVGLLAGAWGMPTTVVPLQRKAKITAPGAVPEAVAVEVAMTTAVLPTPESERVAGSIQIAPAPAPRDAQAAISKAAQHGFDLLWVGTEPGTDAHGVIHANVSEVVAGFDGHSALVFARGALAERPEAGRPRILIPVTGTAHSLRAAEVALALAQACHGTVTALYVSNRQPNGSWRQNLSVTRALRGGEEAILRELVDLAQQYATPLRPLLRTGSRPAEAIVEEINRGPYSLVVLGVTRRPGDTLSLGATAREVLERSAQSVLLHVS